MKLGLLHEVDTLKASFAEQLCYVSFEHKSLQELAAALYITQVLDEAVNIEVSCFFIVFFVFYRIVIKSVNILGHKQTISSKACNSVPARQPHDVETVALSVK